MSGPVRATIAALLVLLVLFALGGFILHLAAFLIGVLFFFAFLAAVTWVVGTVWRSTQR